MVSDFPFVIILIPPHCFQYKSYAAAKLVYYLVLLNCVPSLHSYVQSFIPSTLECEPYGEMGPLKKLLKRRLGGSVGKRLTRGFGSGHDCIRLLTVGMEPA